MSGSDPTEILVQLSSDPIEETDGPLFLSLSHSDNPIFARVRFTPHNRCLSIDFTYPAGMSESHRTHRANFAEVFVGEYSGRLLGLRLVVPAADEDLARSMTRELIGVVRELQERARHTVGQRLNRQAVARDLNLTSPSAPPPWMLEAIRLAKEKPPVSA